VIVPVALRSSISSTARLACASFCASRAHGAREGDIGMQLDQIAKANPGVGIGTYPFFDPQHGLNIACMIEGAPAITMTLPIQKPSAHDTLLRIRSAPARHLTDAQGRGRDNLFGSG
jgi:hypothetical protein